MWAGALPVQSTILNDLNIEDLEVPCGQPTANQEQMVTNVHVQNIPPEFRNIGLKYYLERVMQSEVTCKVEQFNADAVAVFQPPIGTCTLGFDMLMKFKFVCLCRYERPSYEIKTADSTKRWCTLTVTSSTIQYHHCVQLAQKYTGYNTI